MKLFYKLLIILLPISLFYLLAFWLSIYQTTTNYVEDKVQDDLEAIAELRIKEIETWVANSRERLESFNSRLLVRKILAAHPNGDVPAEKFKQLQNIVYGSQRMMDGFDSMHLLAQNGRVLVSTNSNMPSGIFENFDDISNSKMKIILARPLADNFEKLLLQNVIQLIFESKIVGYLVVDTKATALIESLNSNVGLGEAGSLILLKHLDNGEIDFVLKDQNKRALLETMAYRDLQQKMNFEYEDFDGNIYKALSENIESVNWTLVLSVPKSQAFNVIQSIKVFGLAGVFTCALLMVITLIYVAKILSRPIEKLAEHANHVQNANVEGQFNLSGVQEYDKLAQTLNEMMDDLLSEKRNLEQNVSLRTKALTEKNSELNDALKELRSTQNLLIETEKMAALGEMVAGVAHEVNTPIGSALGAATHLMEISKVTQSQYESDQLTEEGFESLLTTNQISSDIVVSNLKRAADLIRSFKRVAVDQSNEKVLEFDLVEYVNDIILSLKPRYKHMKLEFQFMGLDAIKISQNPGIIAQIVTNLIVNAIVHAFENKPVGKITFHIDETANNNIEMKVSDNGNGMENETRQKLFDPFYTTKRGQGGTGLGMNIVHNLVVKNLGGHISVDSEPNEGSCFTFTFPRIQKRVQI